MLWKTVFKRVVLGLCTILAVSVVIFAATNIIPGDAARAILGRAATDEAVAQLQAEMGLDRPLAVQFGSWLWGFVHLDMGKSLLSGSSVWELIQPRLANSLILLLVTSCIAIPLSVILGVLMALRAGRAFDTVANSIIIMMAGIPEFVVGIILILVFSTHLLPILPPTSMLPVGETLAQNLSILVLPVTTLVAAILPYLSRLVRGTLLDALSSEYVVTARLKGVRERDVIIRHALRNSLVPAIQASALSLGYILGGAVVVEFVFQYPGLGTALRDAIASRDLFVIQGVVLIFATGYVVFNLVADVLTILVTPRLRG